MLIANQRDTALKTSPAGNVPVAIYTRVSTENQVGGRFDSCDSQAAVCRDHIHKHAADGWREIACYTDPAYSGGTMNRPGLRALMRQIETGDIKIVLIYKLERMSRNMDEWGPFRAFLKKHGCRLESATEDISESEPEGRLKNNIVMSVAEFERLNTAKKTRIKMLEQAKRGFWNGGMVPLGYNYDLSTKQLTPNPAEAALVRRVFEHAAQLVRLTDIANALNAEGQRTKPRTFVRRDGTAQQVGANRFRSDGLRLIITNPIYRGCVRFAKTEYAGKHEGLVPTEVWERANAAVNKLPRGERSPVVMGRDKHLHLLKGVVYCAHCRRALIPHDSGNKDPSGRPYRYYDCGQIVRSSRDHVCPVGRMAAGSLESVVVGFLAELGRRPEVTRAALTESRAQQRVDRSPLRASLAETEKSLAEVNRQVDNCVEAIAVGGAEVFGDELKQRTLSLRERRQELIVEREQARQELRACDEALLDERRVLAAVDRLGEALPRMKPEAQKEFVALIVDRIEVRALRPDRVKVSQRPLQLAIKLHLPKLVEGMEERVIVDGTVRSRILPRQRSLNLSMQVALGGQGAGGASVILAPFAHRVLSARGTNAAPTETARHAIHRAFQWQRALQADPTLEKQALAAQEEVAPGSITHHLKLLNLTPEIQNFLRGLKDPDAVRYYSLRKMRRLSELPTDGQSVQFSRLQHGFRAGLSGG